MMRLPVLLVKHAQRGHLQVFVWIAHLFSVRSVRVGTERIRKTVLEVAAHHHTTTPIRQHLDVGPGRGELIRLFRDRFTCECRACDYTEDLIRLPDVKVDVANLNHERLPYADSSFDVVTATEVVEHLEHYRETMREFYRVLRPGGLCIVTTPNILNLNSRLRFLWFGYWNLFGPLPVKNSALYSTGGHINPISYFYLAHALFDAGFDSVTVTVDKWQRSAIPKLALLWLPIRLLGTLAYRTEVSRFRTIDPANAPLVEKINSLPMLLGRTIVVTATKSKSDKSSLTCAEHSD